MDDIVLEMVKNALHNTQYSSTIENTLGHTRLMIWNSGCSVAAIDVLDDIEIYVFSHHYISENWYTTRETKYIVKLADPDFNKNILDILSKSSNGVERFPFNVKIT